jgi:hypothetical protein
MHNIKFEHEICRNDDVVVNGRKFIVLVEKRSNAKTQFH